MDAVNDERPPVVFSCVLNNDCATAVKNKTADIAVLGAADTFKAYKDGLVAVAAEDKGELGTLDYYSVAVVNKDTCDANPNLSLADLKGKSACFTGYQRTAGWVIPVGYLLYQNIMPFVTANTSVQNDAESVASFFNGTCAARANARGPAILSVRDCVCMAYVFWCMQCVPAVTPICLPQNGTGTKWDALCGICKGDCAANEPYFDYEGSMICLQDKAGMVSFNKHEVPLDWTTDGAAPNKNITVKRSDVRLLCPQGGCATVDQYARCNFAAVPARAVVVRPDTDTSRLEDALDFLIESDGFAATVLNSTANPSNAIFNVKLKTLRPINDTMSHLGRITQAFEGYDSLSDTSVTAQGNSG